MQYNSYLDLKRFFNFKNYYYYFPLRVLSLFFYRYKKIYIQKKFAKKKNYDYNFYDKIYPPKLIIISKFHVNKKILDFINTYQKKHKIPKNLNYHKNIYQSEHNLHLNKKIKFFVQKITKILNHYKILHIFNVKLSKILISKLWFVITRTQGYMHPHAHLDGELSGVFYLQAFRSKDSGTLNIFNQFGEIEIFKFSHSNLNNITHPKKITFKKKLLIFKPKKSDLVIFSSYLLHAVDNSKNIYKDRISVPFDCILKKI
jgi:uncharacterized protein (TIGR02466 family)